LVKSRISYFAISSWNLFLFFIFVLFFHSFSPCVTNSFIGVAMGSISTTTTHFTHHHADDGDADSMTLLDSLFQLLDEERNSSEPIFCAAVEGFSKLLFLQKVQLGPVLPCLDYSKYASNKAIRCLSRLLFAYFNPATATAALSSVRQNLSVFFPAFATLKRSEGAGLSMFEICYALLVDDDKRVVEEDLGIPASLREGANVDDMCSFLMHLVASEADNHNPFAVPVLNRLTQFLAIELAAYPVGQYGKSICKMLASILKCTPSLSASDDSDCKLRLGGQSTILSNALRVLKIAQDKCSESTMATQIVKIVNVVESMVAACPVEESSSTPKEEMTEAITEEDGVSATAEVGDASAVVDNTAALPSEPTVEEKSADLISFDQITSWVDSRAEKIRKNPAMKKTAAPKSKKAGTKKLKRKEHASDDDDSDDDFESVQHSVTSKSSRPSRKATAKTQAVVDDDSDVDVEGDEYASENENDADVEDGKCAICNKSDNADKVLHVLWKRGGVKLEMKGGSGGDGGGGGGGGEGGGGDDGLDFSHPLLG
jgi:hypothetical protein